MDLQHAESDKKVRLIQKLARSTSCMIWPDGVKVNL